MLRSSLSPPLRNMALACMAFTVLGGGVVLLGWATAIPRLADWFAVGIHTMPNTALAIMVLGMGLGLRAVAWYRAAKVFGAFGGLIGLATVCEYAFPIDLGIDRLLLHTDWGMNGTSAPGRMGLPACVMFTLLGMAQVMASGGRRAQKAASAAVMCSVVIASLSIIGKLYGAHDLYIIPAFTAIAVNTAALIIVLAVGLLATLPDVEPTRTLVVDNAAGMLVRRALVVVVLVPIVIGLLLLQGQEMGLYDGQFGSTMRTIVEVFVLLALLWWVAAVVTRYEQLHGESEAARRSADERYRSFVQLSSEGIWRCELLKPMPITLTVPEAIDWFYAHGVLAECNDAMARMYGFERGMDLQGTPLPSLLPRSAENEAYLGAFVAAGFSLLGGESEERDKDGRTLYFSNNLVGFVQDGFLLHAWGTQQDITERRMAAARLKDSEKRLRMMANNLDQLIWISGGETWLNDRWTEYTGLPAAEIVATEGRVIYHPDEADAMIEKVRAHFKQGEPFEDVLRLRGRNGEYDTFLVRAVPDRDEAGKVYRWFGSHTNITALMNAQQALRDADRNKDEFLATLAHELRNPLTPLVTGLELLSTTPGASDPEMEQVHSMMHRQLAHLVHLVNDLLDVSRISRGKIELRPAPVDLVNVMQDAAEATRTLYARGSRQLHLDLPAGPVPFVGDAVRLTQVIVNLLNNAAKFSSEEGGVVHLSMRTEGAVHVIAVRDNGVGIEAEHLSSIWGMFSQVRSTGIFRDGLGIGLHLVKNLVEMHGGTTEAQSDGLDKGSTFIVRLPLVDVSSLHHDEPERLEHKE